MATGSVVALAELSDPTARLDHHLLWYRHHNAEEVWIFKRRGWQTEDRLLGHEVLCEVHIVFKLWEVVHINPYHEVHGSGGHHRCETRHCGQLREADL